MKHIDFTTWDRAEHFRFFQARDRPQLNVTVHVDVSALLKFRRGGLGRHIRFTDMVYFAAVYGVNMVPAFKQRIVNGSVVEFDVIDSAFTYIPVGRSVHSNCVARFDSSFVKYVASIDAARQLADVSPTLCPEGGDLQSLVYLSCLNKLPFTSLSNPWGNPWIDTVPRFIFGMVDSSSGKVPLSIEVLHSFVDGVHISDVVDSVSEVVSAPERYFG